MGMCLKNMNQMQTYFYDKGVGRLPSDNLRIGLGQTEKSLGGITWALPVMVQSDGRRAVSEIALVSWLWGWAGQAQGVGPRQGQPIPSTR